MASLWDWVGLLLRWFHVIAGIMWIGASLFFHWLDSSLDKPKVPEEGLEGELWMVHSGGFYEVKKRHLQPHQMPAHLHWFKFEALFTLISGLVLLVVVYYLDGGALLLDPTVRVLSLGQAAGITTALLVGTWLVYDALWASPLGRNMPVATAISVAWVIGAAYGLTHLFSGRAAFLHVGAMLGTVMVANVWFRILPAQRELIAATKAGRKQDPAPGLAAKTRSRHNHYMTYLVVYIMLSTHYPMVWGWEYNWVGLVVLGVAGGVVKYLVNIAETRPTAWWGALAVSGGTIAALWLAAAPPQVAEAAPVGGPTVTFAEAQAIVATRCITCHSPTPTNPSFQAPPVGVELDTADKMVRYADRMKYRAVTTATMPLGNLTGMTDEERATLGRWVDQGARVE